MALVQCTECSREISDKAASCPHCGAPRTAPTPSLPACPKCRLPMVATERATSVSGGGIFGAFLFLIGLGVLFANALVGVGIMILAVLIGAFGRSKHVVLVCPRCGSVGY